MRKNIILTTLFVIPLLSVQVSINKGSIEIWGSASYTKYVKSDQSYLYCNPGINYFVTDLFAVGGNLMASMQYYDGERTSTEYGIGPQIMFYPSKSSGNNFFIYLSVGCRYYLYRKDINDFSNRWDFSAELGADIFINNSIAVTPYLEVIGIPKSKYVYTDGETIYRTGIKLKMFISKDQGK